jgi:hypothetical protein
VPLGSHDADMCEQRNQGDNNWGFDDDCSKKYYGRMRCQYPWTFMHTHTGKDGYPGSPAQRCIQRDPDHDHMQCQRLMPDDRWGETGERLTKWVDDPDCCGPVMDDPKMSTFGRVHEGAMGVRCKEPGKYYVEMSTRACGSEWSMWVHGNDEPRDESRWFHFKCKKRKDLLLDSAETKQFKHDGSRCRTAVLGDKNAENGYQDRKVFRPDPERLVLEVSHGNDYWSEKMCGLKANTKIPLSLPVKATKAPLMVELTGGRLIVGIAGGRESREVGNRGR